MASKAELKEINKMLRIGRRFASINGLKLQAFSPGYLFYDIETEQSLSVPSWFVERVVKNSVGVKRLKVKIPKKVQPKYSGMYNPFSS